MNTLRWTSVCCLALVSVPSASAQGTPAAATIMSAERLRVIGDSLAPASSRTAQLGRGAGYTFAVTHRDSAGGLEMHGDWTDVFVIESGSATLLSGGALEGASQSSPGEWRGGVARGAVRAGLHVGDVVVIPAGMPHQMLLSAGERVSYLAFKIAATAPASRP